MLPKKNVHCCTVQGIGSAPISIVSSALFLCLFTVVTIDYIFMQAIFTQWQDSLLILYTIDGMMSNGKVIKKYVLSNILIQVNVDSQNINLSYLTITVLYIEYCTFYLYNSSR